MVLIAYLNMHNRDDNDSARAEHSVVRRAYVTRMQFPYASAYGRSSTIIVRLRGKSICNSFRDSTLNIYRNLSTIFLNFMIENRTIVKKSIFSSNARVELSKSLLP